MSIELTSEPAVEPITLAEAKTHLRYDSTDQDTYITGLITVARRTIERWEWRAHLTQTWVMRLDKFPKNAPIYLPRPPLQSVTSIQYVDADGATQTFDAGDYDVDTKAQPGRIKPAYGEVWPTTRPGIVNAVTVTYVAGYGDAASDVPEETKHAIKLMLTHAWRNPELVVSGTIVSKIPDLAGPLLRNCHDQRLLEFVR
jgi:uncharacterized phiE125 gp8 family phage protein